MAPVVWAALIQGSMTLSAAGLAVWGVSRQIGNWRHEAPGRRKIEVGEKCLSAAAAQRARIVAYKAKILEVVDLGADSESRQVTERMMEHEDPATYWERLQSEITTAAGTVGGGLGELESASDLAEIYYGSLVALGLKEMRIAGSNMGELHYEVVNSRISDGRAAQLRSVLTRGDRREGTLLSMEAIAMSTYRLAIKDTLSGQAQRGIVGELLDRIAQRVRPRAWKTLDRWLPDKGERE
jgi:hypothetical protein